ncbi:MAG: Spy/CpxP family protein refolding chaperone [Verrucomicrobia bacterium]|nr:Spy/CpxP family protein refolding chaperone [Verrucomicrobiota bacterium]
MKQIILIAVFISTLGPDLTLAQSNIDAPDASASPLSAGPLTRHSWIWTNLNLTETQQRQIHGIMASNKSKLKSAMMNVLKAQKALQDAIIQSPSDVNQIRQYSRALESAKTELTVDRVKVRAEIMAQVLTPEQQQRFMQFERQREGRLQRQMDELQSS